MAKAGINKKRLAQYGGEVYCFMSDEDVAQAAKRNGTTRAAACMDKAAAMWWDRDRREKNADGENGLIFAIGNAPTALVRLYELINEGKLKPELIIAAPVGIRQCRAVERADPDAEGYPVYRGKRTERRKQYRCVYL